MAEVTVVADKVRVVEEPGHVIAKLTTEEAKALRTLLYTGTGGGTVAELGLSELMYALESGGVDYDSPIWHSNANL